jgi:mannose-6-phosphate isomerase-like protein (cupin superfamily)
LRRRWGSRLCDADLCDDLAQRSRCAGRSDRALVASRTIAVVDDYDARVVKARGEFTRHSHPETDEFLLVLSGTLTIRMDEGDVALAPGDVYVVPGGRFHQPFAGAETTFLLDR